MKRTLPRLLHVTAALALTVSCLAQPAARTFTRYTFFGDSLSDNGNTFALTGSPPAPYYQGRVSNGLTFPEYVAPGLVAAATVSSNPARLNFAFAGATAAPGSAVPNLGAQLGMFQARGIAVGPADLFVVLAGANDVLNTISNPATQNGPAVKASAQVASAAVHSAVNALSALGAKNILVLNLPDISQTARFTTGSGLPAATLAQEGSFTFNADIKARLTGVPNVTLVDLGVLLNGIITNASTFGLTNVRQEYLGLLQAGTNPGDVGGYLFFDGIHPTTKVHNILATALTEVLNPEFVLGTAAVQGTAALVATDAAADAIAARLDATARSAERKGAALYAGYARKEGGLDWSGHAAGFDQTTGIFTFGVDHQLAADLLVGGAFTKDEVEAKLAGNGGSFDLSGDMVSAYAQWSPGDWAVDAVVGYGGFDLRDIRRTTMFGGLRTTAESTGTRLSGALRVARLMGAGEWQVTPYAGLRFATAKFDPFSETGVPGLNFSYGGQTAKSLEGVVGASAAWQVGAVGVSVGAAYQKEFSDGDRRLTGQLANTVARTNEIALENGVGDTLKLNVAVGGRLGQKWNWSAGYLADLRDRGDTASQFSVVLGTGF